MTENDIEMHSLIENDDADKVENRDWCVKCKDGCKAFIEFFMLFLLLCLIVAFGMMIAFMTAENVAHVIDIVHVNNTSK